MRTTGCLLLTALAACSSGGSGGSGNPIAPGPNPIPEVSLTGEPSVDAGLPITMTVQATDEDGITEIVIDWDDGTVDRLQVGGATSHQAPVTHVYGSVGVFRVEATATDTRQATGRVVRSITTQGGGVDIGLEHSPGSAPLIARVTVTVGSQTKSVLDGGVVRVSDLVPGEHQLTAEAVRSDCAIEGDPTRTVRVDAGSTARVDFSITCTFVPEERILYNPHHALGFEGGQEPVHGRLVESGLARDLRESPVRALVAEHLEQRDRPADGLGACVGLGGQRGLLDGRSGGG